MGEPELIFHDTVPIEEERLPQAREKAIRQKDLVLDFFRQRYSMNMTPMQVHIQIGEHILLTSIRRCITDLTKEGKLIKCDWSDSKDGGYGVINRTWKYNRNFLNPINPPKK
jgi:hypothetical protein